MRYAMFSTVDDPVPRLGAVHEGGMADARKASPGWANAAAAAACCQARSGRSGGHDGNLKRKGSFPGRRTYKWAAHPSHGC